MNKRLKNLLELGVLLVGPGDYPVWESGVHQIQKYMLEYHDKPLPLVVKNVERKWELVSAYQKTVRRGNLQLALRLVSAMASMESERPYMWRRICTTSAEDIGAGNQYAMKFVLACSQEFTPSALTTGQVHGLWVYLTHLMCGGGKSRLYCQYSILENALVSKDMKYQRFDQSEYGLKVKNVLSTDLKTILLDPGMGWLLKSNWRAEGMAVGPVYKQLLCSVLQDMDEQLPVYQTLKGLPEYCYDMHTRVGKATLYKACGVNAVGQFFHLNPVKSKPDALGWALFFEEGGKVQGRLGDQKLDDLEQLIVAERHGLELDQWLTLRQVVRQLIASGRLTEIREGVLKHQEY